MQHPCLGRLAGEKSEDEKFLKALHIPLRVLLHSLIIWLAPAFVSFFNAIHWR